jgi:oxygen-independent coproporphyrinogen-3 oxidase
VSNFAKPGYRSRHNSSYWQGKKYLGLGPSAHSYNGVIRKWNIANNNNYIEAINNGKLEIEREVLTETQKLNEYIMISLRTIEGLDLEKIKSVWGEEKLKTVNERLIRFEENDLVIKEANKIKLTEEGMLRADGIAADLFAYTITSSIL